MNNTIYLDNAASTAVNNEVLDAMLPYFNNMYGNASSIHSFGRQAQRAIGIARRQTACALGATNSEIYFTSSGSESDNWAIKSVANIFKAKGKHIIASQIEHPAVLNSLKWLEKQGFDVTYIPVDSFGKLKINELKNALREDTILISVMYANNETGTIQDIETIGEIAKNNNVLFHTDAVQAVGSIPIDLKNSNIDMLSLSAHKFYGPKGIGALYIRDNTLFEPFIHGGAQEHGMRASTENTAGIVGLGRAISIANEKLTQHNSYIYDLRELLWNGIKDNIKDVKLNGHPDERLNGTLNISIKDVPSELLVLNLDLKDICVSGGSACTSGDVQPSHVLQAMYRNSDNLNGVRFSIGRNNTKEEITKTIAVLSEIVDKIRK